MWEKKEEAKKKESPPSCSFPPHVSLSLTSSAADNPQITGSYFIIGCRPIPRLSLTCGEGAEKRVRDIREAGGRLWMAEKSVLHAWQKWCERWRLLRKKTLCSFYHQQSEKVEWWTLRSLWVKGGWSMYSSIKYLNWGVSHRFTMISIWFHLLKQL